MDTTSTGLFLRTLIPSQRPAVARAPWQMALTDRIVLKESEVRWYMEMYPALGRAEVMLTIVRFGPSRQAVEDALAKSPRVAGRLADRLPAP